MQKTAVLVRRYFQKFPRFAVASIILGLVLLKLHLVFVLLVPLGGYFIYHWFNRPTDENYDQWLETEMIKVQARALDKGHLSFKETVSEPVILTGPRFHNLSGAQVFFKKGNDGIIRYSPIFTTVVNFTEHQLVVYQCLLDMPTSRMLNENTKYIFYKDVVSWEENADDQMMNEETIKKHYSWFVKSNGLPKDFMEDGSLQLNKANSFTLLTSAGKAFSITIKDPLLIGITGGEMPTQKADIAISALNKMLKDKSSKA